MTVSGRGNKSGNKKLIPRSPKVLGQIPIILICQRHSKIKRSLLILTRSVADNDHFVEVNVFKKRNQINFKWIIWFFSFYHFYFDQ